MKKVDVKTLLTVIVSCLGILAYPMTFAHYSGKLEQKIEDHECRMTKVENSQVKMSEDVTKIKEMVSEIKGYLAAKKEK